MARGLESKVSHKTRSSVVVVVVVVRVVLSLGCWAVDNGLEMADMWRFHPSYRQ